MSLNYLGQLYNQLRCIPT